MLGSLYFSPELLYKSQVVVVPGQRHGRVERSDSKSYSTHFDLEHAIIQHFK